MPSEETTDRYEIARQFTEGYADAIATAPRDTKQSKHWLAGWDQGYSARALRSQKMNEYLVSIGVEPMAVVRPC